MATARLSQNIVIKNTNLHVSKCQVVAGSLVAVNKLALRFSCICLALAGLVFSALLQANEAPVAQEQGDKSLAGDLQLRAETSELKLITAPEQEDMPIKLQPLLPVVDSLGLEVTDNNDWVGWMASKRHAFSRGFTSMADSIDRFFAGTERIQALDNESYFKLTLGGTRFKAGRFVLSNRVKIKLDLPGTQHKWKLVFTSDDEQDRGLAEQASEIPLEQELIADSGATGAFRYVLNEYKSWRLDVDLGIKTPFPVDPFVRLRARRPFDLDNGWRARLGQQFYYYHHRLFVSDSSLAFEKALSDKYFVRNTLRAKFTDDENDWEFSETLSTYHILNQDYVIDYNVGLVAFSQPSPKIDTLFINTKLRKRLYEDWLFIDFQPGISFPRDNNYKLSPSFGIRLEVLLCHNSKF